MPKKQNVIVLSQAERTKLEGIVKGGKHPARTLRRAQTLLWSAAGKSDLEIGRLLDVTPLTVAHTRQRWVQQNTLVDQPRPGRPPLLDGKQEAFLVALACSDAPEGQEKWTMQLLADRLLQLEVVDEAISEDTVSRRLKKTNSNRGKRNNGVLPK